MVGVRCDGHFTHVGNWPIELPQQFRFIELDAARFPDRQKIFVETVDFFLPTSKSAAKATFRIPPVPITFIWEMGESS